jgi:hypothetical protein
MHSPIKRSAIRRSPIRRSQQHRGRRWPATSALFALVTPGAITGLGGRAGLDSDDGMSTAEYAIGTIAAAAFAGILYAVVTNTAVVSQLTALIHRALTAVS